jgi:hypothetical protein
MMRALALVLMILGLLFVLSANVLAQGDICADPPEELRDYCTSLSMPLPTLTATPAARLMPYPGPGPGPYPSPVGGRVLELNSFLKTVFEDSRKILRLYER